MTAEKRNDFHDFCYVKFLRNVDITVLHITPRHLSHVASLPFDLHIIISSRFHYVCILVRYVIRKQSVTHLPTPN